MSELSVQYQPYLDKDYFVENVEFEVVNKQVVFLLDGRKSYRLNGIFMNLMLMGQSVQSIIQRLKCEQTIEQFEKQYEYETILIYYVKNCKREGKKIEQSIINQLLNISGILIQTNKLSDLIENKEIEQLNQGDQQQINTICRIYKDIYEELIIKKYITLKQIVNNKTSEDSIKMLQDMFKISEYDSINLGQKIIRFKVCGLSQLIVRNKEEDNQLVNFTQKN